MILKALVIALVILQGEGAGFDVMGIAVCVWSYRTGGACRCGNKAKHITFYIAL